jgi:hypothetical protein
MRRELGVWALVLAAPVLGALACNAVVGVGAVAVMGGVGYFAGQCYDRVHIKVRDAQTGRTTCDAKVSVAEADGGGRSVRPCYNVALTEGHWHLTASIPGYVPASAQVEVPERSGSCPYYTHTIELTLQREGVPRVVAERAAPAVAAPAAAAVPRAPARPPFGLMPITSPAAAVPVTPTPPAAASESPGVPTRAFEPPPPAPAPDAGAPR